MRNSRLEEPVHLEICCFPLGDLSSSVASLIRLTAHRTEVFRRRIDQASLQFLHRRAKTIAFSPALGTGEGGHHVRASRTLTVFSGAAAAPLQSCSHACSAVRFSNPDLHSPLRLEPSSGSEPRCGMVASMAEQGRRGAKGVRPCAGCEQKERIRAARNDPLPSVPGARASGPQ